MHEDPRENDPETTSRMGSNPSPWSEEPAHPDALDGVTQGGGLRDRLRDTQRDSPRDVKTVAPHPILPPIAGHPELTLRQSTLVTAAVLLRLAGYDQLRRLVYPGLDPSLIRRDVRAAVDAGLLLRWSFPAPNGARIGHVHPTDRANAAVLPGLRAASDASSWGKTVRLMLPSAPRRALTLDASVPKWFPHQREVNHLVASIACSTRAPLVWASSFQQPFPTAIGACTMPQPDYVLVEMVNGAPQLVFGEHDRGHELVARFIARKVALYARLASQCEELFGVRSFRVDVTVIDCVSRQPIRRLEQLLDATKAYGAEDLVRFTLGGWLYAEPKHTPWFRSAAPGVASVRMLDHLQDATG
jgi:hypothetical protein